MTRANPGLATLLLLVALMACSPTVKVEPPSERRVGSLCLQAAPQQGTPSDGWITAGANPQRTSWVPDAAPGMLKEFWVKPVEPYISQKVQIIAAAGKLFLSTARGLYAFNADTGAELWVGGLLCGLIVGLPAYFATRWGINAFRHLREARQLPHGPFDR